MLSGCAGPRIRSRVARTNEPCEHLVHPSQRDELLADARARDLGGLLHRLATSRLPHTKREERANLIERESHRLRAANEHDATDRVRSVFTVAACRAVASAQQAAPLVVPERLHAHARRLSDGPDAQRDFHTM